MNVGKNTLRLPDVTGVAISAGVTFQLGPDVGASLTYTVTGAGQTFTLEGRMSDDAPWVAILTSAISPAGAGSAQVQIPRMLPQVRVNQTAGAGTVSVWVMA